MKAEIKAKLLEALRSNTYKKCEGFLHKENAFCTLGVLVNIVRPENPWVYSGNGVYEVDHETCELPTNILHEVGLTRTESETIIEWNDSALEDDIGEAHHRTFPEIADLIEEQIPVS